MHNREVRFPLQRVQKRFLGGVQHKRAAVERAFHIHADGKKNAVAHRAQRAQKFSERYFRVARSPRLPPLPRRLLRTLLPQSRLYLPRPPQNAATEQTAYRTVRSAPTKPPRFALFSPAALCRRGYNRYRDINFRPFRFRPAGLLREIRRPFFAPFSAFPPPGFSVCGCVRAAKGAGSAEAPLCSFSSASSRSFTRRTMAEISSSSFTAAAFNTAVSSVIFGVVV